MLQSQQAVKQSLLQPAHEEQRQQKKHVKLLCYSQVT